MAEVTEAEKTPTAVPGKEGKAPAPEAKAAAKPADDAKGAKGGPQTAKGAGKEEAAATATVPRDEYVKLQKAHEATLGRIKELEGKAQISDSVLTEIASLKKHLNMQAGEQIMSKVEGLIEAGNEKAADDMATREMARRAAALGVNLDTDPALAHLKLVPPRIALHQFLVQEPTLMQKAPAGTPATDTKPPDNGAAAAAAAQATGETIGGKNLEELKMQWAKENGLFKGIPEGPAGSTLQGLAGGKGDDLLRAGVQEYHRQREE